MDDYVIQRLDGQDTGEKKFRGSVVENVALTDQRFKLVFKDASFRANIFPFNGQMRLKIERMRPFVENICFLIFKALGVKLKSLGFLLRVYRVISNLPG